VQLFVADRTGPEGVDSLHQGTRLADDIGQTDFAFGGQAGGYDVFGDVAGGISAAAVDFAGIFAAKGAAADAGVTAVGIDDDLAAGQAGVALRAGDVPQPGAVDDDVL
jgi:hypothetical protein